MAFEVVLGQVQTPLGVFGAAITPAGVGRLTFPAEPFSLCEDWVRRWMPEARAVSGGALLRRLSEELAAYLEGGLRAFTIPVDLRGTPFQLQVWQQLQAIPYGAVRSYAEVAAAVGRPRAVRAVGAASGRNPVPILVPCHRVVGSDGTLVGYAGGLPLKRILLELEGAPL